MTHGFQLTTPSADEPFRLQVQADQTWHERVMEAERVTLLVERGWEQWGPHPDYWLKDGGPLRSLQEAYWEEVTG